MMHDDPVTSSQGVRDGIAAWLVCLALAAAGLLYPEIAHDRGTAALARQVTPAAPQAKICALPRRPVANPHG
jgi:hypothetical protein